jgi:c-di-GMP-binding flagellar brake protein YcgR
MTASFYGSASLKTAESRHHRRHIIMVLATVMVPGAQPVSGHVVDISNGGLGLLSPIAIDQDQEITVVVPLETLGESRTVVVVGRVCYCNKQGEQLFRIGLQFVSLDPETAKFVAAICS